MKDKHKPLTGYRHLAPRFWTSWLGVACMRLVILLPYRAQLGTGRLLGRMFRLVSPYREQIVRTNLELVFPDRNDTERRELLLKFYESLGMTMVETAAGLWKPDRFFKPLGEISGLEHIQQAQADGRGVLLLSGHFCSLDFAGRILMNHQPACFTFQELRNKLMDKLARDARQGNCKILIHRHDTRAFIRALKAGEVVWYAPDQDQGRRNSVFAPLFGRQASTLTATTKLAKLTGAAVLPFIVQRLAGAKGYRLRIDPPLENFPGASEKEDAARFNSLLEAQIREHPEQYLWVHRRFKTRPEGEEKPYPQKPRRIRKKRKKERQRARSGS